MKNLKYKGFILKVEKDKWVIKTDFIGRITENIKSYSNFQVVGFKNLESVKKFIDLYLDGNTDLDNAKKVKKLSKIWKDKISI